MDVYTWVIFMYVAGTILVGWFLLNETGTPVSPLKKDSLIAPGYWAVYSAAVQDEAVSEKSAKPGDVDDESESVATMASCGAGRTANGATT